MNASEFGCGAAHQLAITAAKAGWELIDFTALTQSEEKCIEVLAYLRGQAEIKMRSFTRLILTNRPLSDGSAVEVHQLVEGATFDQMFHGLTQDPTLDCLCMSKDQREKFLGEHLDQFPRSSWMLFLHKEGGKFLVAYVGRCSDGYLYRHVYPLSNGDVWSANVVVRLVVPQRNIKSSTP